MRVAGRPQLGQQLTHNNTRDQRQGLLQADKLQENHRSHGLVLGIPPFSLPHHLVDREPRESLESRLDEQHIEQVVPKMHSDPQIERAVLLVVIDQGEDHHQNEL